MPGAEWIWVVVWIGALFAVLMVCCGWCVAAEPG